jgi:tetrahydromethanopterin S-methyltransferase subunit C
MGLGVMRQRLDNFLGGFIIGMIGNVAGFFTIALIWAIANNMSVQYFINEIFLGSDLFKDKILTVSALLNVIIFFFANRAEYYRMVRGIIAAVLFMVPFIIYYNQ